MKIVKVNQGIKTIFDTENSSFREAYTESTKSLTPLHHVNVISDFEFLNLYFSPEHQILIDFQNSYYYMIGEIQDLREKEAIKSIIEYGKSKSILVPKELEENINKALETFNNLSNKESILGHREICARQLIISSIYALNKEQLYRAEKVVLEIARDERQLKYNIRR